MALVFVVEVFAFIDFLILELNFSKDNDVSLSIMNQCAAKGFEII